MIVYKDVEELRVLELGTGKWFLLMFPAEITDEMFDTLVKDSSNPHIHVSPNQVKFIAWYSCS